MVTQKMVQDWHDRIEQILGEGTREFPRLDELLNRVTLELSDIAKDLGRAEGAGGNDDPPKEERLRLVKLSRR